MRLRAIISIGNYEFCLYSLTNLPFCVENLIYKILNHISIHWLIVQILYYETAITYFTKRQRKSISNANSASPRGLRLNAFIATMKHNARYGHPTYGMPTRTKPSTDR